MEQKHELLKETAKEITLHDGRKVTVQRIRAVRTFGNVKQGDIGGWVEKDGNLSHTASCWIYDEATVVHNAMVTGNTSARENALMMDWATLAGDAIIRGNAIMQDECVVTGNAIIEGNARCLDVSVVAANARLHGTAVASSKYDDVIAGNRVLDKEPELAL